MEIDIGFQPSLTLTTVIDGKEYKVHVSELENEKQLREAVRMYDNMRLELGHATYEVQKLAAAIAKTKEQVMMNLNQYVVDKYDLAPKEKEQSDE